MEGRLDLLNVADMEGDPMEAAEERLESMPPKDEMEQLDARRLEAPEPGVRSIGTLRLVLATAAPCTVQYSCWHLESRQPTWYQRITILGQGMSGQLTVADDFGILLLSNIWCGK